MYTVRQFLDLVYPSVNQYGATHSIGTNGWLPLVQHAVNQLWNYKGYIRSWQHTKEAFPSLTGTEFKLKTSHTIKLIDKFYCGRMTPLDGANLACNCPPIVPDPCGPVQSCPCSCENCVHMPMKMKSPQNELCSGQYQISGGEQAGMGGLNGSIITMKPGPCFNGCNGVWVTYYRGAQRIRTYDDILMIPDNFMTALAYFAVAPIIGSYAQYRAGDDVNFITLARQEMDSLKMDDNIFPKDIQFDPNRPFYGDQVSTNAYNYN